MIFTQDMAKLVLEGRKTLTIRNKTGPKCRYKLGACYSIQVARRTKDEVLTVMSIEEKMLGDLNIRELRRAGFKTTLSFREWWDEHHRSLIFGDDCPVWLVSFDLGDLSDTPRLLAARPGAPHGDYVSSSARALRGEPEAIPAVLQARFSTEAKSAEKARQNGNLAGRVARLLELVAETAPFATDARVKDSFRVAERGLRSVQRKIER